MDNEKEIPFGAFDSELMHQEITIPEGFEATIEGNKIILKKTESDDVKIRKELIKVFSNREKYLIDQSFGDITVPEILAWIEKQGTPAKLSEEEQNRFAKIVLTSCAMSFIDYLDAHKYEGKMCVSNGECEDIENAFHNAMWDRLHRYYCKYIEKQGTSYTKRDVDDAYLKGISDAKNELEKQGVQPKEATYTHEVETGNGNIKAMVTEKVQLPKFKVKYAGNEYNVLEIKESAEAIFYGIEDEPNHIDYVKAENCEIISGYAIKENGSPYPTKPAVFSEQKPQRMVSAEAKEALYDKPTDEEMKELLRTEYEKGRADAIAEMQKEWSEEDEEMFEYTINLLNYNLGCRKWLQSLKERYTWKPSDDDINLLEKVEQALLGKDCHNRFVDFIWKLKKLKGE